jgi:hypothetical protein
MRSISRKARSYVDGGDERIEFEGIERNRPAVDERDIAEMQVAVSAADKAARSARRQQRPDARKRRPAGGREPLDRSGGEQRGVRAKGSVVLVHICAKGVDPRRGCDHRRAGVGRGNGAGEAVRQREFDSAMVGETIEGLGLVEAAHLDRIFDGLARTPDRQCTARLARDRDDTAIDCGRKRAIGIDLGDAGLPALFQRREIQERKTHRTLDLVGALSGQEHRGSVGIDAAHVDAAMSRRPPQICKDAVLGFDRVGHFSRLPVSTRRTISRSLGYFSTASTDVTTKV